MQNTAYEMRISDWSSDVCSADLRNAGVVVDHPATLVTLGDLTGTGTLLACLGFVLMVALEQRRVPGAIIVTILLITAVGIALGVSEAGGIVSLPPSLAPTFLQLDKIGRAHV